MSYKKYNWSFIAADYASSFMRNRIWTHALPQYPKVLKLPPLPLGIIGRGSDIEYVTDMEYWQAFHEAVSERAYADLHFIDRHINMILVRGEEMNRWSQTSIFNADLSRVSNVTLWSLFSEFIERQSMMYLHGIVIVLLDFHQTLFIEGNLEKILRSRVPGTAYQSYYSVFTKPIHNSFAQDQEEHLLRIMAKSYRDRRWRRDVQTMTIDKLRERYPAFIQALARHTATYAWVYYVYSGPAYSEEQFLDFVRDYLVRGVNLSAYLVKLHKKRKEMRERKKRYLAKLSPNPFERMILNLAGKIVWSKPRRKDLQSRTYYHVE
ncbi:MAG: hypothetical protein HYV34_01195, partial [Candidatus Kerfeldbacteria bacterium]|nr:hypothetical protein [Candidatus Kerfeldbacteria bacterium]